MINLDESVHLRHERDGHALNVNEFCYRHREGAYRLGTTKGAVMIRPGDGASPAGRRAMMDRPELWLAKVLAAEAEQKYPCLCRQLKEGEDNRRRRKADKPDSVSASQLATWRRALVQLLRALDQAKQNPAREGVASHISRLQREGVLPREAGAVMLMVTEMRNAAEYEAKRLTDAESALVRAAWKVIQEWALGRGLKLPD